MKKNFAVFALAVVMALTTFVVSVTAEMDCPNISHWSGTNPPVNQQHVFCGKWNKRKNRPVGFHSRPDAVNPETVEDLRITQQPNVQGIYGVRWSYAGHPERQKFSSMFPDTCSRNQVLKSIVYAGRHPKPCPTGTPHWAKCGFNKPTDGSGGYCEALDGTYFTIGFATLKNSSKINTAFPIVE